MAQSLTLDDSCDAELEIARLCQQQTFQKEISLAERKTVCAEKQ